MRPNGNIDDVFRLWSREEKVSSFVGAMHCRVGFSQWISQLLRVFSRLHYPTDSTGNKHSLGSCCVVRLLLIIPAPLGRRTDTRLGHSGGLKHELILDLISPDRWISDCS
jgi:hypothetical protein